MRFESFGKLDFYPEPDKEIAGMVLLILGGWRYVLTKTE
jgi:hypothetical protein